MTVDLTLPSSDLFIDNGCGRLPFIGAANASRAYRETAAKLKLGSLAPQFSIVTRDGAVVGRITVDGSVWSDADGLVYSPLSELLS